MTVEGSERKAPSRAEWLALGLLMVLVLLLHGIPVPIENEGVHLARLAAHTPGSPLATDWTVSVSAPEYFLFDQIFGLLPSIMPLGAIAWTGRLLFWPLIFFGLLRVGKALDLGVVASTAAIAFWLCTGQSLFAGSWIFAGFEAKVIAHTLFVTAVVCSLLGKVKWVPALLGATFSFHPAVGLLGGSALALALLANPDDRRVCLRYAWLGLVLAVPGAMAFLLPGAKHPASPEDWAFLATVRLPHHADPFYYGTKVVLVTLIMAVYNLVYWGLDSRRARLLGIFQAVLLAQFVFGVAALQLKLYGISAATPFRMFSLWTFLLFVFGVAHAIGNRQAVLARRSKWVLAGSLAVAGVWLLVPGNPVVRSARNITRVYEGWRAPHNDLIRAVEWSAKKFPAQVGIVPTEIDPAQFYGANVIVSWKSVRYDRVSEWRKRLDDLLGGRLERYKPVNLAAAFAALPLQQIELLKERYGARYLVTKTAYALPVLHQEGPYRIYDLGPVPKTDDDRAAALGPK